VRSASQYGALNFKMKQLINDLYKFNRCLMGSGYDNAIEYLKHLLKLEIIEVPSGTKLETWTVPDEWIVRDAWVKFKGKKILDYKKEPLCLMIGSEPFKGTMDLKEFKKRLYTSFERPDATSYEYTFYEKKWGFSIPKSEMSEKTGCEGGVCTDKLKGIDPKVGKVKIEGEESVKWKQTLKKGKYEVFIDTEFKKGTLKIAVHTIKGKTDREVLLFAHLDHPYQANDNLSGVACLVGMAKKIKRAKLKHTVKLIFCPETIGSIAYAITQDISKVDFMMAVDIVGNDNTLLIQKSFNELDVLNYAAHLSLTGLGISFRKGQFKYVIGSDEYVFNDPNINIPGLLVSRFPYDEYHTSDDTPDIVSLKQIKEAQKFILETIRIMEMNYVPVKLFKGPLMRTKFGAQTESKQFNRNIDYLFYLIDGKKSLAVLCCESGVGFNYAYNLLEKLKDENLLIDSGEKNKFPSSK